MQLSLIQINRMMRNLTKSLTMRNQRVLSSPSIRLYIRTQLICRIHGVGTKTPLKEGNWKNCIICQVKLRSPFTSSLLIHSRRRLWILMTRLLCSNTQRCITWTSTWCTKSTNSPAVLNSTNRKKLLQWECQLLVRPRIPKKFSTNILKTTVNAKPRPTMHWKTYNILNLISWHRNVPLVKRMALLNLQTMMRRQPTKLKLINLLKAKRTTTTRIRLRTWSLSMRRPALVWVSQECWLIQLNLPSLTINTINRRKSRICLKKRTSALLTQLNARTSCLSSSHLMELLDKLMIVSSLISGGTAFSLRITLNLRQRPSPTKNPLSLRSLWVNPLLWISSSKR